MTSSVLRREPTASQGMEWFSLEIVQVLASLLHVPYFWAAHVPMNRRAMVERENFIMMLLKMIRRGLMGFEFEFGLWVWM